MKHTIVAQQSFWWSTWVLKVQGMAIYCLKQNQEEKNKQNSQVLFYVSCGKVFGFEYL